MDYAASYILTLSCLLVVAASLLKSKPPLARSVGAAAVLFVIVGKGYAPFRSLQPKRNKNQSPVPVGGGWSFFLKKRGVGGTYIKAGLVGKLKSGRWGADTRIKDLQRELVRDGLTLSSYPSVESGTLGGWIASGSHGSGGSMWRPCIGKVVVLDMQSMESFEAEPKTLFNERTSTEQDRRFLILEVEVLPTKNVWCKKTAHKMLCVNDAARFLHTDTLLRMAQIGGRGVMCLMWTPLLKEEEGSIHHVDPHIGSQLGLWLQADVLSILQTSSHRHSPWFAFPVEPASNYTSRIRLADANRFTPDPHLLLSPIGLAFHNFEIFVDCEVTPALLFQLCDSLSDVFSKIFGRCELRCGGTRLFLDFVLLRGTDRGPLLRAVKACIPDGATVSCHKGKSPCPPPHSANPKCH